MRCWKVLGANRESLVSGTGFKYPPRAWTKHLDPESLALCKSGYHFCEGRQVLDWLNEGLLCEVEPCAEHKPLKGDNKCVSCRLRIVRTFLLDARVLRLFACDCAERALLRERKQGREPDKRLWDAIRVARRFAVGKATEKQLVAAYAAYAATTAAAAAARTAERDWQYRHLLKLVEAGEP